MITQDNYDVIVIGAGPAGSAVSYLLSKQGLNVCLFEKRNFPREVLCGEFLSAEVSRFIKNNNLLNSFNKLNANEIITFTLNTPNNFTSVPLGFTAYGLRRSVFDNFLLTESHLAGTTIIQPAEVTEINKKDNCFLLKYKKDNTTLSASAKYVICAYGKQNILDKKLGRSFYKNKTGLNGIKYHIPLEYVSSYNENTISIFLSDGIYCGLNKTDGDNLTLCFLEKYSGEAPEKRLLKLHNENADFRKVIPDIHKAIECSPIYGTGNIFFGKRNAVENGLFMCGDSANVIAPVTGDGIGMAIQSAELLSEMIIALFKEEITYIEALGQYSYKLKQTFNNRLRTAYYIQKMLLSGHLQKTLGAAVNLFPSILPHFIKITRDI